MGYTTKSGGMSNELNNIVALNTDGVREGQGFDGMCVVRVGIQHEKEGLVVAIEEKIMIRLFFFKDTMCIWKFFGRLFRACPVRSGGANFGPVRSGPVCCGATRLPCLSLV